ncbi:hypothetical protein OBG91_15770 [Lactococcus lactis]|nr:hypothetical protein [Lactococcus lactis]
MGRQQGRPGNFSSSPWVMPGSKRTLPEVIKAVGVDHVLILVAVCSDHVHDHPVRGADRYCCRWLTSHWVSVDGVSMGMASRYSNLAGGDRVWSVDYGIYIYSRLLALPAPARRCKTLAYYQTLKSTAAVLFTGPDAAIGVCLDLLGHRVG